MRKYIVTLTDQEQDRLKEIIAKRSSKSVIVKRAFVLLALDENNPSGGHLSDQEIRATYHVSQCTIERLRKRFVEDGFEIALEGKKQTRFKEKTFDGRVEAQLITLRCSDAPDGYEHWSLRLLADTLAHNGVVESISHESVRQILKKTNLNRGKSNSG